MRLEKSMSEKLVVIKETGFPNFPKTIKEVCVVSEVNIKNLQSWRDLIRELGGGFNRVFVEKKVEEK